MDRRALARLVTRRSLPVLFALVAGALIACDRTPEVAPEPAPASQAATTQPAAAGGAAESDGLVGTDVVVEAVALEDIGPPAPTLVFTAGIKGYTEPCGCTLDLILGGIDRVTGAVQTIQAQATASLVLDAGNLLFEYPELDPAARPQLVRKTEVILGAVAAMGTRATTVGPTDLAAGIDFYLQALGATTLDVVTANVVLAGGAPFALPWSTYALGDQTIGVVGAAAPEAFLGVEGVEVLPPSETVPNAVAEARAAGATTVVALFQGDIAQARRHLGDVSGIDFILLGAPRNTDAVERAGDAFTLEAYDQGRYVGRLKLFGTPTDAWSNAQAASSDEIERLQRVIGQTEEQLAALPAFDEAAGDPVPPIVQRLRDRVTAYQRELAEVESAAIAFTEDGRFLYTPIGMVPGLPVLESITDTMRTYNRELRAINLADAEPPVPAIDGQPHYIGAAACATCHPAAMAFWQTTQHAHAIDTLIEREKEYDHTCIGCHVTGYREPGGSALADWRGLENVQCEQCHGPGSFHARAPTEWVNVHHGVVTAATEATCVGCHNEEHSTTFEFSTYLPRVLGPGHGGS